MRVNSKDVFFMLRRKPGERRGYIPHILDIEEKTLTASNE
jgi:hypothetical protein